MKIRVQHPDGRIEALTLTDGAWTVRHGAILNRLTCSGFDHFFTQDGHYDGWGGAVNATASEASDIIHAMETKRDIEK